MNNKQSNNLPFKDPDVWDPPPPIERKPVKRVSKNMSYAPQHNNIKNRQGNLANNKGKKQDPNGKKTFLQ